MYAPRVRGRPRARIPAAIACLVGLFVAPAARAQTARNGAAAALEEDRPSPVAPLPPKLTYLQYGVAVVAEFAADTTPFCIDPDPSSNCVLGSGGGVAMRAGWRSAGHWYFGGAYELTKQDPSQLYRLAILQQLRGEARYYLENKLDVTPFAAVGLGVAGYGNEWSIATWGPAGLVGGGAEIQFESGPVLGVALGWRPLFLKSFEVSAGDGQRGPGFAHMVALEITLEVRDPL